MVQAARSGRQNIAEGSRAAAASSQTELRLVNVARASLDELLLDYEDFLRQRGLPAWSRDAPEARRVRSIGREHPTETERPFGPYAAWLASEDSAVCANAIICLIHQTNFLLDRQIASLEKAFVQEGGYTERLAAARIAHRKGQEEEDTAPDCPQCGKPMALRTARKGANAGAQFWGCSAYPQCRGTRKL